MVPLVAWGQTQVASGRPSHNATDPELPRQTPASVPVLITRPEPQASRLAQDLRAVPGARPVVAPLMETVFPPVRLPPGDFAGVILTSETGAKAAGRLRAAGIQLPQRAHCVGRRTAEAAERAGFTATADGATVQELLASIPAATGPLLYLRGAHVAADLVTALQAAGIATEEAIVYAQEARPLSPEALALLSQPGPVIVPLFSARSARLFEAALPSDRNAQLLPCVISETVFSALSEPLSRSATRAETPDGPAMLQAIARVITSLSP